MTLLVGRNLGCDTVLVGRNLGCDTVLVGRNLGCDPVLVGRNLGCDIVLVGRNLLTYVMNVLLHQHYSNIRMVAVYSFKIFITLYQTTQCHISQNFVLNS